MTYGVGSVLSGGGAAPDSGNNVIDWANRVNELKQAALETRLGIPLLYGVDAVHGNNNAYATTIFPHNMGLGSTGNLELVEKSVRLQQRKFARLVYNGPLHRVLVTRRMYAGAEVMSASVKMQMWLRNLVQRSCVVFRENGEVKNFWMRIISLHVQNISLAKVTLQMV